MASQEGINQDQTVDPGVDEKLKTVTIAETLPRLPECSSLYAIIRDADLEYRLRRSGLHTLFAPDNAALEGLELADPDAVEEFLSRHLLAGGFESFDLRRTKTVKTVAGHSFEVHPENGSFRIANARIVRSDIPCTNGVVQIIDAVLAR